MKQGFAAVIRSLAMLAPAIAFAQNAQGGVLEAERNAVECNTVLSSRQDFAPIAKKLVLSSDGKPTLEMQADISKPTAVEKQALSRWMEQRNVCFGLLMTWMGEAQAPQWFKSTTLQFKDSADALIASLFREELTFGDYNFKLEGLRAESRRRMDEAATASQVPTAATQSPVSQVAPPEPKRDLAADMYACQMEAARTFPVQMSQRMVSPGFQASPPQGTRTTCRNVGYQVVCDSQPSGGIDASIYNRPPTYVNEDVNLGRRNNAVDSCMSSKGYQRR